MPVCQALCWTSGSCLQPHKHTQIQNPTNTQQPQWPVLRCKPSLTGRDISCAVPPWRRNYKILITVRDRECISAVPHLKLSRTLKLKWEKAMKSLTATSTVRLLSHQKEDLLHSCSRSWCREQMLLLFCVYPFFLKLPSKAFTEILSSSNYADKNVKPRLQPWICSWTLLAAMPQSCL